MLSRGQELKITSCDLLAFIQRGDCKARFSASQESRNKIMKRGKVWAAKEGRK